MSRFPPAGNCLVLALSSGLCLDILADSWQDACEAGMALQQLDVIGVADFKGNGLLVSHPLTPTCSRRAAAERGFCRWLDGYKGSDWVLAAWTDKLSVAIRLFEFQWLVAFWDKQTGLESSFNQNINIYQSIQSNLIQSNLIYSI